MVKVYTEPGQHRDWLQHTMDSELTFKQVFVKAGAGKLTTGTVLKKAGDTYEPAQAGDTFAGILYDKMVDASTAEADEGKNQRTVIVKWGAAIIKSGLVWHESVDTDDKKMAIIGALEDSHQIRIAGEV